MKIKLQVFLLIIFSAVSVFSQNKAVTVKVAEYDDRIETSEKFSEKIKILIKKVSHSPGTYGVVAIFPHDASLYKKLFKQAETIVGKNKKLKDRIEIIPVSGAKYGNENFKQTEFWLVPKDAEPPYGYVIADCDCPKIEIYGEKTFDSLTKALVFTANVTGGSQAEIKYKWKVSTGKIIEGQGTAVVKVFLTKKNVEKLTVSVEVKIDCFTCDTTEQFESVRMKNDKNIKN